LVFRSAHLKKQSDERLAADLEKLAARKLDDYGQVELIEFFMWVFLLFTSIYSQSAFLLKQTG
jgi:hypothetical protein